MYGDARYKGKGKQDHMLCDPRQIQDGWQAKRRDNPFDGDLITKSQVFIRTAVEKLQSFFDDVIKIYRGKTINIY